MSNSSSDSFQPIKEDQNEINLENSSPPISNSSDGYQNLDQVQENQEKKSSDVIVQEITATAKLGKSEVADDDEGFRTPTSLDQRIPVIPEKCPPAPRKPRPSSPPPCSRKRKFSRRRNIVRLDFSSEVGSFFPTIIREDLGKKMKKSPKSDDHGDDNK